MICATLSTKSIDIMYNFIIILAAGLEGYFHISSDISQPAEIQLLMELDRENTTQASVTLDVIATDCTGNVGDCNSNSTVSLVEKVLSGTFDGIDDLFIC